MEALFLRVIWISLTCSAVLFPLLLAGRWLRRHVRAKSLYVVWLVLALRLVIPVELTLPEPVMTVEAPELSVVLTTPAPTMTRQDDVSVWEGQTVRPRRRNIGPRPLRSPSPSCWRPSGLPACWASP